MEVNNPEKLEKILKIIQNEDGTLTRSPEFYPTVPPSLTDLSSPSLSKDVTLNSEKSTRLRIFLPTKTPHKKLHIIVYVHGGGFVVASASHPNYQDFCTYAASSLAALVVSVEYRLAPEHRLPAAYDDVLEALTWVRDGKDEWVREYGDVSSCVLMGDSAGGNIVFYSGLMAADRVNDLKPLNIKGLILVQPFFSGLERTESELRLVNDSVLPLEANDLCWDLGLPIGANRGHEFCDPVRGGGSVLFDRVRDLGWRVWVMGCDGDPLYDRGVELVKLLEKRGVSVRTMFVEGGQHGMFVGHPSKFKAKELVEFVREFFLSNKD